jgi:hypothetical protein
MRSQAKGMGSADTSASTDDNIRPIPARLKVRSRHQSTWDLYAA